MTSDYTLRLVARPEGVEYRAADVRVQPFRMGPGLCIIGHPTSTDSGTA